jgi:hypothetical protein
MNPEAARSDNRKQRGTRIMTAKEHPIPKSKMVIRKGSERCLALQYEELLRLRQAVRHAELLTGSVSQNQPTATTN